MHNRHDYSGTLIGLVHRVRKIKKSFWRFTFLRLQVEVRKDILCSAYMIILIWSDFDRASSLLCGNKMPTRCNRCCICCI